MKKLKLTESELIRLIEKTIKENNYKSLKEQTQLPDGHELRQEFEILNRKLDRVLKFVGMG